MSLGTFATAINCMDGRVQEPVARWLKERLGVEFVDAITESGPDKWLSERHPATSASIRQRVSISVHAHRSRAVAIVAHDDCAGNPVPREEHLRQLASCVEVLASWNIGVRILSLWVNGNWQVELVGDREAQRCDP